MLGANEGRLGEWVENLAMVELVDSVDQLSLPVNCSQQALSLQMIFSHLGNLNSGRESDGCFEW